MDIVVGFIPSAEGRAALQRGIEEATTRKARLVIVNSSRGGNIGTAEDAIENREELERISAELDATGVDHEVRELVLGNSPAEDVLRVAEELGAGLIVIGLRRRSRVGKLVLGSNSQDILLGAECPVLSVKPAAESD